MKQAGGIQFVEMQDVREQIRESSAEWVFVVIGFVHPLAASKGVIEDRGIFGRSCLFGPNRMVDAR